MVTESYMLIRATELLFYLSLFQLLYSSSSSFDKVLEKNTVYNCYYFKGCSHGDVLANWMRLAFTLTAIICEPNRIESNAHWANPHCNVVWKRIQSGLAIKRVGEPVSHSTILKMDGSWTAESLKSVQTIAHGSLHEVWTKWDCRHSHV